jgi:integrase
VKHIEGYYRHPDGTPTGTAADIKVALGYLKRLYAPLPIGEFGVPELKAVREAMVTDGRVRNQVNKRVSMIRSFVRWCVEERLAPAVVLTELKAVRPLAAGRCGAVEGKAVQPADPATVEKAVPFMPPAVRAIVKLLRLTGARPTELMTMRPRDLDRAGDTWAYTVSRHKGSWRGKSRLIHLGPEARAVLSPWLDGCDPDEYVFTPARSEAARSAERAARRATPKWPSHVRRNSEKKARSRRELAPRYNRLTLLTAVRRACEKAQVVPFSPYQLRHLRAAELRKQFDLEVVRAVLGHSAKSMSDHYSQSADAELAGKAMATAG